RYYQAQDTLIQNNIDNPRLLAELKLQMANALVKLNRAYEACQLANEAVGVFRQLDESLDMGDVLREYATTLVACGRLNEALAILDEASLLFERGRLDHHAWASKLQRAEILLEMGDAAKAYDEARKIKEYFESHGLVARSIRASLVMVACLIEQAQQAEIRQEKEHLAILIR